MAKAGEAVKGGRKRPAPARTFAELGPAEVRGLGQVFIELGFLELAGQAVDVGHEGALAVPGHDHALVFEVEVGPLDGDDADLEGSCKCPN